MMTERRWGESSVCCPSRGERHSLQGKSWARVFSFSQKFPLRKTLKHGSVTDTVIASYFNLLGKDMPWFFQQDLANKIVHALCLWNLWFKCNSCVYSAYFSSVMSLLQTSVLHCSPEYFIGDLKGMGKAVEQEKLFGKQVLKNHHKLKENPNKQKKSMKTPQQNYQKTKCGRQAEKNVFVIHYWAAYKVNRGMGIVLTTLLLAGWWGKRTWTSRSTVQVSPG